MEQKILKTSVFGIDTVFGDSAEQPIDIEFTLPDYYADISKILKCCSVARISSKNVNGSSVSVEGSVTVTVIYCGTDNRISSYEYRYPFSKTFDSGINTEGTVLTAKAKCEYINCRAVTGRKIDIHGAAGIYVTLTRRKVTDVICDIDDATVELLRGTVPATVPMGCADKYLLIDEEIELGDAQPDIRCLIRYGADATISDSKILAGKSVAKGELTVNIFYSAENGEPQNVKTVIPFSQFIEIDGLTDECNCDTAVCVADLDIKPRISATGQSRSFLLSAKLLITSECCCNNDVGVILDAYSRKYQTDISKNKVSFGNICENVNDTFNCKKNIQITENSVAAVSDIWCDTKIDNVTFCEKNLTVNGKITIYIIAQNDDGLPLFYENAIDFEYKRAVNSACDNFKCTPKISVAECGYTLSGSDNIEIRVDLNINAAVYELTDIPLVTDLKINTSQPCKNSGGSAMTVYFAETGERTWDIARKYFAPLDEIKQINGIEEDVLSCDKVLLVPN